MALTRYYILQDATNGQYYTDNHDVEIADRWSLNINDAFKYALVADVETELNADSFSSTEFRIMEVIIKS
jgi:hypothetical protein